MNQNGEDKGYVLDSSAFLTLFEDEKGSETVQELLELAKKAEVAIFVCLPLLLKFSTSHFGSRGEKKLKNELN